MADTAELLLGLSDLRLPDPGVADIALALGAGLLIAAALGGLIRSLRRQTASTRIADRIATARALPAPERSVALALLLREVTETSRPGDTPWVDRAAAAFGMGGAMKQALSGALYKPGVQPDPEMLEDLVRRAARSARV